MTRWGMTLRPAAERRVRDWRPGAAARCAARGRGSRWGDRRGASWRPQRAGSGPSACGARGASRGTAHSGPVQGRSSLRFRPTLAHPGLRGPPELPREAPARRLTRGRPRRWWWGCGLRARGAGGAIGVGLSVMSLGVERRGDLNARESAPDRSWSATPLPGPLAPVHHEPGVAALACSSRASRAPERSRAPGRGAAPHARGADPHAGCGDSGSGRGGVSGDGGDPGVTDATAAGLGPSPRATRRAPRPYQPWGPRRFRRESRWRAAAGGARRGGGSAHAPQAGGPRPRG